MGGERGSGAQFRCVFVEKRGEFEDDCAGPCIVEGSWPLPPPLPLARKTRWLRMDALAQVREMRRQRIRYCTEDACARHARVTCGTCAQHFCKGCLLGHRCS